MENNMEDIKAKLVAALALVEEVNEEFIRHYPTHGGIISSLYGAYNTLSDARRRVDTLLAG